MTSEPMQLLPKLWNQRTVCRTLTPCPIDPWMKEKVLFLPPTIDHRGESGHGTLQLSCNTMSSDDDESSWVFESLVGYLRGPAWNIPIITFIEQKSIVFEPGCDNEEYRKIHNEYKNLVDFMLGSHMEDMGITPEQFEKVCGKPNRGIAAKFHQGLFEQVWAADDYEIFKRMMTQKNIDLQLQALEIMAQRYGLVPDSFQGEPQGVTEDAEKADEKNSKDDEEVLMAHVMKKSLEEEATVKEQETMEEKLIQDAIQATLLEKQRLEAEKTKEKELLDKALKLSLVESPQPPTESEETVRKEKPSTEAGSEQQNAAVEDDELAWRHRASAEEVNQRREYLRNQRDKLVALKRAEREKQLNSTLERDEPQRPRSARAARAALGGTVTLEAPNMADQGNLAFRKSLAARLKAEVIDS
ncbi:cilia- and flagella-associated protein 36-like isoform X2 [Dermacentor albipictus]|uniref:cilia- and flagella-associated protein 36-like isoform X2 n=1 Tax=Dermacentor albipictus TaxID=60249 RepID=UPI0038FC31AC